MKKIIVFFGSVLRSALKKPRFLYFIISVLSFYGMITTEMITVNYNQAHNTRAVAGEFLMILLLFGGVIFFVLSLTGLSGQGKKLSVDHNLIDRDFAPKAHREHWQPN